MLRRQAVRFWDQMVGHERRGLRRAHAAAVCGLPVRPEFRGLSVANPFHAGEGLGAYMPALYLIFGLVLIAVIVLAVLWYLQRKKAKAAVGAADSADPGGAGTEEIDTL